MSRLNLYHQLSSSDLHLTGVKDEDHPLLLRILEVLKTCRIRSYTCDPGIFEGDLSQWSLGPKYHGHPELPLVSGPYPCGTEVAFYFDHVLSVAQQFFDGTLSPREAQTNFDLEIQVAKSLGSAGIPHYPKAAEIEDLKNRIVINSFRGS